MRVHALVALWFATFPAPHERAAISAAQKVDLIQSGRAAPRASVLFSSLEVNAWARYRLPLAIPEGARSPRLEFAKDSVTGYALIDFLKIRHGEGVSTPWLIAKLIEGERPVKVQVHVQSGAGKAIVFLDRVEISGLAVTGSTLNFMIDNFFHPLYPEAKINQPFELSEGIDHVEITPAQVRVVMGARRPGTPHAR